MSGTDQTVSATTETYEAVRDDRNALRRLLQECEARNAALWPVAEAAITFVGVDHAMMNDPSNPMQRQAWHATLLRLQAAVKAYQETTK